MRTEPGRLIAFLFLLWSCAAWADNPRVVMTTSLGDVVLELDEEKAPVTVANFLGYVRRGDYDNTIFHRVIPGFMVQAGGHTEDLTLLPEGPMIRNEADNGLTNLDGTIAMARMGEIDSASRQFFINVADNPHLDHKPTSCTREERAEVEQARARGLMKPLTCDSFGYAVFGRVVEGMDVIREIELVETRSVDEMDDVPVEPLIIRAMRVVGEPAANDE